jgi:hypothetical protein
MAVVMRRFDRGGFLRRIAVVCGHPRNHAVSSGFCNDENVK